LLARQVSDLRRILEAKQQLEVLEAQITELTEQLQAGDLSEAEKERLNSELQEKKKARRNLKLMIPSDEASETLQTSVQELVARIDEERASLLTDQVELERLKAAEKRAAEKRFRAELSAASVDPDTYAPAKLTSIDPVAQVSISVIGEGVLHLRGPRRGVMAVREMIDQIDHPVGQVKIGILTIQLNGEHNDRMINTVRRVEGNISRARFLAYASRELFKRAVVEVATDIASGIQPVVMTERPLFADDAEQRGDPQQKERWARYMQAFFGADFLNALREVDPQTSLLNPLNQLLSLHSADTLTLAEALFVTALAKGTVRDEILARFDCYLQMELPRMESQWMLTNGIYCRLDPRWWGDAEKGRARVEDDARRKYTFQATRAYFQRCFGAPELAADRLNPLQREVVKLVQGIALEQSIGAQYQALLLKRSLLQNVSNRLSKLQRSFLDAQIERLHEEHLAARESLRGRKAAIDMLIKQVMIAIEDDVHAQFYGPALERIRKAASEWDVELGEVEQTTILTNNRAFAKVEPQATYEFDLPKRDILIAEALKAAYALHQDIGPLLADPEFGTLASLFVGSSVTGGPSSGTVKNVLPTLSSGTDQQALLYADPIRRLRFETELEKLIPNPAIYKFETGTGFEVRPVIQPDGQSVVFDFNYMYSTDLLEPVRPDEKHLGRVKRHFIHTQVQLGTLEWREISRYDVALKAARTARGVPLLEDIPIAGMLFRPLPQAQKSLQKNIIIGQAVIYPTVQDLLGLRPAAMHSLDPVTLVRQARCERDQNQLLFQQLNQELDRILQRAWQENSSAADRSSAVSSPGVPPAPGIAGQNDDHPTPKHPLLAPDGQP